MATAQHWMMVKSPGFAFSMDVVLVLWTGGACSWGWCRSLATWIECGIERERKRLPNRNSRYRLLRQWLFYLNYPDTGWDRSPSIFCTSSCFSCLSCFSCSVYSFYTAALVCPFSSEWRGSTSDSTNLYLFPALQVPRALQVLRL